MWSRTAPPLNLDWNPNHFVPLVKIDHMHKHMMSVTVASTDTVSTICTGSTLSSCNTFTNSTTKLSVPALSSILAATNTAKQPIYATLDSYVSSNHCHKRSLQDRDTSRAQQRRQKITGPANEPSLATIFLTTMPANRSKPKPRQKSPIHMQVDDIDMDNTGINKVTFRLHVQHISTGYATVEDGDSYPGAGRFTGRSSIVTSVSDSLQDTLDFNIIVDDGVQLFEETLQRTSEHL